MCLLGGCVEEFISSFIHTFFYLRPRHQLQDYLLSNSLLAIPLWNVDNHCFSAFVKVLYLYKQQAESIILLYCTVITACVCVCFHAASITKGCHSEEETSVAAVWRQFTLQKRYFVMGGASTSPASCAVSKLFLLPVSVNVETSEFLTHVTCHYRYKSYQPKVNCWFIRSQKIQMCMRRRCSKIK